MPAGTVADENITIVLVVGFSITSTKTTARTISGESKER
jgi:hypothetical protein